MTPSNARWGLVSDNGRQLLTLSLDDAGLPVPYMIDPIASRTSATGSGSSGMTVVVPSTVETGDLIVLHAAVVGGTGVSSIAASINGAIAEDLGYLSDLDDDSVGIMRPVKITANGPDYITFNVGEDRIVVGDAKASISGRFPAGDVIPASKMAAWNDDVSSAVANYSGKYANEIQAAFDNGNIVGQYFKYIPTMQP